MQQNMSKKGMKSESKIPVEVAQVRPINTRAKKQGDYYSVIKRTSKRVDGKTVPVELGVVGHIKSINGKWKYIPKVKRIFSEELSTLEYGFTYLLNKQNHTLLDDLSIVYSNEDATFLYTLSILRCAYTNVSRDAKINYENDYISRLYPSVRLDESYISKMLNEFGKRPHLINKFMINRLSNGSGKYIIDGMLKTNDSYINSLSEYSRKGSKKGRADISLMYCYDSVSKEPIASSVYPGNMLDQTAVSDFIENYTINKGILIMDKGFYSTFNMKLINSKKDLKYIVPIKRSDSRIDKYHLTSEPDGILNLKEECVFYKKIKVEDELYLYAFLDIDISKTEAKGYITKHKNDADVLKKFKEKNDKFGLVVFESNVDMKASEVYDSYEDRWEIETVFKYYQSILDLDTTRVHDDNRLVASEFINFISTIMTLRLKKLYRKLELTPQYSYDQIKNFLFKLKINSLNPEITNSWKTNKTLKLINEVFKKLRVI